MVYLRSKLICIYFNSASLYAVPLQNKPHLSTQSSAVVNSLHFWRASCTCRSYTDV